MFDKFSHAIEFWKKHFIVCDSHNLKGKLRRRSLASQVSSKATGRSQAQTVWDRTVCLIFYLIIRFSSQGRAVAQSEKTAGIACIPNRGAWFRFVQSNQVRERWIGTKLVWEGQSLELLIRWWPQISVRPIMHSNWFTKSCRSTNKLADAVLYSIF